MDSCLKKYLQLSLGLAPCIWNKTNKQGSARVLLGQQVAGLCGELATPSYCAQRDEPILSRRNWVCSQKSLEGSAREWLCASWLIQLQSINTWVSQKHLYRNVCGHLPFVFIFWGKIWDLASRPGWPSTQRKEKFILQGVLTQTKQDNCLLLVVYSNHLNSAGVGLVERSPSMWKALGTLETRLCGCNPGTWRKKQKIRVILGWKLSFKPIWAAWHRFQINKYIKSLSKALMTQACKLNYQGGWGLRIAWTTQWVQA